jgi:PilZ domain
LRIQQHGERPHVVVTVDEREEIPMPSLLLETTMIDRRLNADGDRRRGFRYAVGLPVTVQMEGLGESLLAELADVSNTGCFLRGPDLALYSRLGERLTFGFVLRSREAAMVRGRVVRRAPGEGLGLVIEEANETFDELLADLMHNRENALRF